MAGLEDVQYHEVLFEEETAPDSRGRFQVVRVVETDMHYPYVRLEEHYRRDSVTGESVPTGWIGMAADHVMVKAREGIGLAELRAEAAVHGLGVRRAVGESGFYLIDFPVTGVDDVPNRVAELKPLENWVEQVEPDYVVTKFSSPNDPRFLDDSLWGMKNKGQSQGRPDADIKAIPGWSIRTDASDVVVAVIDTGVHLTHEDIIENLWVNPREFRDGADNSRSGFVDDIHGVNVITGGPPDDLDGHGTHVAGTIGAVGNNGIGVAGVAWDVQLMAIKFLDPFGFTSDAVMSIDYARTNGAHVMNNSWGGGGFSIALLEAIRRANDAGIHFVAAAGNSALDNDSFASYPANYTVDNVISVAAMDRNGRLATFSNFGAESVHVMAPGVDILSTTVVDIFDSNTFEFITEPTYASFSGTSMAAPHVAGMLALLVQEYPGEGRERIKNRLLGGADRIGAMADQIQFGRRANLVRAFAQGPSPVILQGLEPAFFVDGDTHTFEVEALGPPVLRYAWFGPEGEIAGASGPTLTLSDMSSLDAGLYRVEVSSDTGDSVFSEAILSHAAGVPEIAEALDTDNLVWQTSPGLNRAWQVVPEGVRSGPIGHRETSWLQTTVAGPGTLNFTWAVSSEKNFDTLSFSINGENRETISGDSGSLHREYRLPEGRHTLHWEYAKDVSNSVGQDRGLLTAVSYQTDLPVFVEHPRDLIEVVEGDTAVFHVEAVGAPQISYFWTRNGQKVPGATGPQLRITNVNSQDAGEYRAVANNSHGVVESNAGVLSVAGEGIEPAITSHPESTVALSGNAVSLSVGISGTDPIEVRWHRDGVPLDLPGADQPTLTLPSIDPADAGEYYAHVSNPWGKKISEEAYVTVVASVPFSGDSEEDLLAYAFGLQDGAKGDESALPALEIVGEDPVGPSGRNLTTSSGTSNQYLSLVFNRPRNISNVDYRLEASADLQDWFEVPASLEFVEALDAVNDRIRLRELEPIEELPRRFLRLRVITSD